MEGVRVGEIQVREVCDYYYRLLKKLLEHLVEADSRTPHFISSKPHISRAKQLAEGGLDYAARCLETVALKEGSRLH